MTSSIQVDSQHVDQQQQADHRDQPDRQDAGARRVGDAPRLEHHCAEHDHRRQDEQQHQQSDASAGRRCPRTSSQPCRPSQVRPTASSPTTAPVRAAAAREGISGRASSAAALPWRAPASSSVAVLVVVRGAGRGGHGGGVDRGLRRGVVGRGLGGRRCGCRDLVVGGDLVGEQRRCDRLGLGDGLGLGDRARGRRRGSTGSWAAGSLPLRRRSMPPREGISREGVSASSRSLSAMAGSLPDGRRRDLSSAGPPEMTERARPAGRTRSRSREIHLSG